VHNEERPVAARGARLRLALLLALPLVAAAVVFLPRLAGPEPPAPSPPPEETASEEPTPSGDVVVPITDPAFEAEVRRLTGKRTGDILQRNVVFLTYLELQDMGVKSLAGIEYFASLERLDCSGNRLTELDVGRNPALTILYCDDNALTELDVGRNPALTNLGCSGNALTRLDVSRNIALRSLYCDGNALTELNVGRNAALTDLGCSGNALTALDLTANTALERLDCSGNALTALELGQKDRLQRLDCSGNALTELGLRSVGSLVELYCAGNRLEHLDVSACAVLRRLECGRNLLDGLDLSANGYLRLLECNDNPWGAGGVSGAPEGAVILPALQSSAGEFWGQIEGVWRKEPGPYDGYWGYLGVYRERNALMLAQLNFFRRGDRSVTSLWGAYFILDAAPAPGGQTLVTLLPVYDWGAVGHESSAFTVMFEGAAAGAGAFSIQWQEDAYGADTTTHTFYAATLEEALERHFAAGT
jgi:hypothetical protein